MREVGTKIDRSPGALDTLPVTVLVFPGGEIL